MIDFNFKEGDKIYYPTATNEVLKVGSDSIVSYLDTDDGTHHVGIESGSKFYNFHYNPAFFPATQEWYDRLVHTYPDLEEPPTEKTAKEIIRLMEEAGHKFITCKAKDPNSNLWEIVVAFGICSYCSPKGSSDYMYDSFGSSYFEFYPINSKGQKIIDFVDGEMVLED